MSNRVSGTTQSLGSLIALLLKQSRTQSETLTIQVESQLNLPIDVTVHLESTTETAMHKGTTTCRNCYGDKSVCRRCGRTPVQLISPSIPPCNGGKQHEFTACPECGGKGKVKCTR